MLVLTRKVGESLIIGDNIKVTIVEAKGSHIRVGINAPDDCRIFREEIYLKVQEQNRLASSWEMADFRKAVNLLSSRDSESQS
jgi:carbon storage regulator